MQEVEEEEESVEERYRKMSKHEKLALLMIALGEDAASTLLKRFDSKDAEGICKRIGDFSIVDQELKDCVLCLLYTSPSPRDRQKSRMPSSA